MLNATQTSRSATADEREPRRTDATILAAEPAAAPEPDRRFEADLASVREHDDPELRTEPEPEPPETPLATRNGTDAEAGIEAAPEEPREPEMPPPAATDAVSAPPAASVDSHMEIRFAKLNESATVPSRANEGDAGMDLCAAEAARIGPGQRVGVGTGLAVEIPEGWAGMVLPRSGLALKNGIALVNSPGLIDPGYRGEIRVLLLNTDATAEFKVAVGDRIAQLVLTPFSTAKPVEAADLEATVRGEGGFGSSGV